jgi:carboxyl-terminal processing protease
MRSGRTTFVVLLGLGACAATAVMAREMVLAPGASLSISDSPKEVMDQVWQIVFRDYLDTTGKYTPDRWRKLRRDLLAKNYDSPKDSYGAIRGMLGTLDDPYTRFLDPREFKEMQIDTSGELSGVGIQLSLDKDTKELVVIAPIEGSPASRAGVKPKDVIVAIDGKSTKGMNTEDAVKLIRGKSGTAVTLTLRRKSETIRSWGTYASNSSTPTPPPTCARHSRTWRAVLCRAMCSICAAIPVVCWWPVWRLPANGSMKVSSSPPKPAMAFRM